ncbi:hypothetical protein [Chitinophaga filiformis]|uniref:Uncharacterized protein n=1 Tax=Chitinophaga filiformis TaxID=104663 RepID=A0A1G7H2N0_CHIFI|nr:hypothetical protein [Chitinophaga filiformis]SDE94688.1 hypothetical protein SAMN04488121_101280 [Chitinophaga filiformis]
MNTPTPYEKLIAEKLDQVPVPDMADSIWASIEMQLDVDANTPDNTSTPKKATKFKGKGWYGAAGAATIAVALWWFTNHKDPIPEKGTPAPPPPTIEVPITIPDSTSEKPVERKPIVPVPREKNTAPVIDIPPVVPEFDSTTWQVLPPAKPDSQVERYRRAFPPAVDSVNTRPIKKSRGVKGITEDDYRLSVDSTHKPK